MIAMAQGNPRIALKLGLADFYSKQEDVDLRRNQSFFVDLLVRLLNSTLWAKSASICLLSGCMCWPARGLYACVSERLFAQHPMFTPI